MLMIMLRTLSESIPTILLTVQVYRYALLTSQATHRKRISPQKNVLCVEKTFEDKRRLKMKDFSEVWPWAVVAVTLTRR